MPRSLHEALSRILIAEMLKESAWDLLNAQQVRFAMNATGRVGYIPSGQSGLLFALKATLGNIRHHQNPELLESRLLSLRVILAGN